MQLEHDGIALWYATDDAPAPEDLVAADVETPIVVGVRPAHANNEVEVLFRVNGGPTRQLTLAWWANDAGTAGQYFKGRFPPFPVDATVEYVPVCRCSGRQVPEPSDSTPWLTRMRVQGVGSSRTEIPAAVLQSSALKASVGAGTVSTNMSAGGIAEGALDQLRQLQDSLQRDTTSTIESNEPAAPDEAQVREPESAAIEAGSFSRAPAGEPSWSGTHGVPKHSMVMLRPERRKDMPLHALKIGGIFAIRTDDKERAVEFRDFLAYSLTAELLPHADSKPRTLHHAWGAGLRITASMRDEPVAFLHSTAFEFGEVEPTRVQDATVCVLVKSLEGSVHWRQEFRADDPALRKLVIEVPHYRPIVLRPTTRRPEPAAEKRLRGQVVALDKSRKLRDLTVVVHARTADTQAWRVVAAGTTDAGGNFSLRYPRGHFVEARALVSEAPESPVPVDVTQPRNGDETIADDFLYLLLQDKPCQDKSDTDDCHCSTPGAVARLPDQASLIGSDEYTQDIGGACVNLSTPNRTLSEFNYVAIVRTSDPDVANYELAKSTAMGAVGLDPIARQAVVRALGALEAALRDPDVRGGLPGADWVAAEADLGAIRSAIGAGQSGTLDLAVHQIDVVLQRLLPQQVAPAATVVPGSGSTAQTSDELTKKIAKLKQHITAFMDRVVRGLTDWSSASKQTIEVVIREAIDDAGGTPLSPTFFAAFPWPKEALPPNLSWPDEESRERGFGAIIDAAARAGARTRAASGESATPSPVLAAPSRSMSAQRLVVGLAGELQAHLNAAQQLRLGTRYVFGGLVGAQPRKRQRRPVDLDNAVAWQGEDKRKTLYQAVTVATGHLLHYKSEIKADGYSLGDLLYSLPLAPGQKKNIVVLDALHRLAGSEQQGLSQRERLGAELMDERTILSGIAGRIGEKTAGGSTATTSGISAGLGAAAQGQKGGANLGAVLGVSGGVANANSNAWQSSSRDVSEFFGETLRQTITQNANAYRQMNASVVTTVEEGQSYGVTTESVANHNRCHALTIMYFEVLRHYAVFQRLSSVEECVFVPLLMTEFTGDKIHKWRDVLALALLPMAADTYLRSIDEVVAHQPQQHPLLRAFDANERIITNYANVDYPTSSYAEGHIEFLRGSLRLRVELPRPRTRFDRIMSLPVTRRIDGNALADAVQKFARDGVTYGARVAFTAGLWAAFEKPPQVPNPLEFEVMATEALADAFMKMDANYGSVPPAQSMRIISFRPQPIHFGSFVLAPLINSAADFFADNIDDRRQWQAYARILGYADVESMLDAHFKGNLISEWDTIFYTDIAPLVVEKIVASLSLSEFTIDSSIESKYRGAGERVLRIGLTGRTTKQRNQLPLELRLSVGDSSFAELQNYVTLVAEDLTLTYSTAHYNSVLFSGTLNDDLLDGSDLYVPVTAAEKRNPRKEDAYLVHKLTEHLNANVEYYNKALWYDLGSDRRYMLLDGFDIQIYSDDGIPMDRRSLASVVKNELVTVVGNSLVFPVAPGYRVSQSYIIAGTAQGQEKVSLLDHYQPLTPIEPYRISVSTRGVFAEAVQGACNACEKIEKNRLQDWSKYPIADEPTAIQPIVAPTPSVTDWKPETKDFAAPIVNVQNAPTLPAPGAGLSGLADLLGKAGVFGDITGLDGNQQNAIRTYLSNQENAKAFAEMAKDLAVQKHTTEASDRILEQIDAARRAGRLTDKEASDLTRRLLEQQIGGDAEKDDQRGHKLRDDPEEEVPREGDAEAEWAPWPGQGSPPPLPVVQGGKSPSRTRRIKVSMRAFVPSKFWFPPSFTDSPQLRQLEEQVASYSDAADWWLGRGSKLTGLFGSLVGYLKFIRQPFALAGDGRGFELKPRSSRFQLDAELLVRFDAKGQVSNVIEMTSARRVAPIVLYGGMLEVTQPPSRPKWWIDDLRNAQDHWKGRDLQEKVGPANLFVDESPVASPAVVLRLFDGPMLPKDVVEAYASTLPPIEVPVVAGSIKDWGTVLLELLTPSADANFKLTFAAAGGGKLECRINATHDEFPAFELMVGGALAYKSHPDNFAGLEPGPNPLQIKSSATVVL